MLLYQLPWALSRVPADANITAGGLGAKVMSSFWPGTPWSASWGRMRLTCRWRSFGAAEGTAGGDQGVLVGSGPDRGDWECVRADAAVAGQDPPAAADPEPE